MLTAAEVAHCLRLSVRAVYDLAASGAIPSFRFGRAVRFDPADVEAYRTSCRSAGIAGTSAGASSSTVCLKAADTDLAAFFRAAGVKPRLTPTTAAKRRALPPLQLVSSGETR